MLVVYVPLYGLWVGLQVALREGTLHVLLKVSVKLVPRMECTVTGTTMVGFWGLVGLCFVLVALHVILIAMTPTLVTMRVSLIRLSLIFCIILAVPSTIQVGQSSVLIWLGVILIRLNILLVGLGMREALLVLEAVRPLPPGGKVSRCHKGPIFLHLCPSDSVRIWGDGDRGWLQYLAIHLN